MHDLLETLKNSVDFLFVQEAPYHFVRRVPSTVSELGDELIGPVIHRNWQCIDKRSLHPDSQVAIYVNARFTTEFQLFPVLDPSTDPNVLVLCVRHNLVKSNYFHLVNVYNRPGSRHSAIESLLRIAPSLPNLAVIQGDFNLHSPLWDPGVSSTSSLGERLFNTLSDLQLNLANDDGDATWTNRHGATSVIDLLFYHDILARVSPQTLVDLEGRGRSDHAILFLSFDRQSPHWGRPYIARDSEEEASYLHDLAHAIVSNCHLDPDTASDNILTAAMTAWRTYSKRPKIDSNPNTWWTDECQLAKDKYLLCRSRSNLAAYNAATKAARQAHFMHKIDLMTENNAPWEGVRWTKHRPPPKYSTILDNGKPIADMPSLFRLMHAHFSSAINNSVNEVFLSSIAQQPVRDWPLISVAEIKDMLRLTSNCSAPGPDYVTWHHIKAIFDMENVGEAICLLFNNICITRSWPRWFKESISVIIPKPKKPDYTLPKAYRPIALLNTLGKLLTKVIANRLQHDAAAFSLLHEGQCGGVQKHTTIDAGLALADFINTNRERGWHVSACAIDVAQFFPSLNHHAVAIVFTKLGFAPVLVELLRSYFQDRTTVYRWDTALSEPYDFSMGTPQGDCLSPIVSALYLSVAIKAVFPHVFPPSPVRSLFFVDDSVLYTASESLARNVRVLSSTLTQLLTTLGHLGLQIEPSKTELIHFFAFQLSSSTRTLARLHQPPLTFRWNDSEFVIKPAEVWRYLGFFFTPSLDWTHHIQFYTNKAFSSVRACAMLGNSIRGIGPKQRSLAYQGCALPILTYGSALWYAPQGVGVSRHIRRMDRVHSFALNWITGTFRTTPLGARGVIAGIPPLRIVLDLRLHGLKARLTTLGDYHIVHSSRSQRWINPKISSIRPRARPRHLPSDNPLTRLTTDEVREQFMPFHDTSRPGSRLQDVFADRIIIDAYSPKKGSSLFKTWLRDLTVSISALHSSDRHVLYTDGAYWNKSARGAHSFTAFQGGTWQDFYGWCPAGSSFDSEIVAIETAIQWACVRRLNNPIFFIDNKAALTTFLDTRVRGSQTSCIRISQILHDYLASCDSTIEFRYCPSHSGIEGNERADRLTKQGAAIAPLSPPRILLSNFINDFAKRMTLHWRILFTSQRFKGHQWLPIRHKKKVLKPTIRNKATTNFFYNIAGNDIGMLSRMARALTNHAPTGEYRMKFHQGLNPHCPTCPHHVQSRTHILFSCPRYFPLHSSLTNWSHDKSNSKSWKTFFSRNPSAFTFGDLPDDVH
ncbi:hypothetical protein AX14_014100 [Amanita brunnescens Koide BX004]|nr:hypothetical protein AX14_014100 [Amanita brunnescens Koide BX004]